MKKLILCLMFLCGCTYTQEEVEEVLDNEGIHNVTLGGYGLFDCSDDDHFRTRFSGYRTILQHDGTTQEHQVSGVLCCGFFKNCTIRY